LRGIVASQDAPAWVGYAVPRISKEGSSCCWTNWSGGTGNMGCCLEERKGQSFTGNTITGSQSVMLEGPRNILVLFRVESRAIQKVRSFTEDCPLDAGGLAFHWLTDVKPAESVALLEAEAKRSMTAQDETSKKGSGVAKEAIMALAQHADASADRALEGFLSPSSPEWMREHAAFWVGSSRGARGVELLKQLIRNDPSPRVREKVTFALSVSHEPEGLAELIRTAKEDESPRVRSQALFWLGQKAGQKAVGAITGAIENDPDTEVKKKAVFALSQLPKDEGVPLLIQVAKTNKNPAVRKQAMFWLGQSNDPRALAFFEEVLAK
jgi:HEAT repeat protein